MLDALGLDATMRAWVESQLDVSKNGKLGDADDAIFLIRAKANVIYFLEFEEERPPAAGRDSYFGYDATLYNQYSILQTESGRVRSEVRYSRNAAPGVAAEYEEGFGAADGSVVAAAASVALVDPQFDGAASWVSILDQSPPASGTFSLRVRPVAPVEWALGAEVAAVIIVEILDGSGRPYLGTERFDTQIYAAPLRSWRRPSSPSATLRRPRMWFDVAIVGQVADPTIVAA